MFHPLGLSFIWLVVSLNDATKGVLLRCKCTPGVIMIIESAFGVLPLIAFLASLIFLGLRVKPSIPFILYTLHFRVPSYVQYQDHVKCLKCPERFNLNYLGTLTDFDIIDMTVFYTITHYKTVHYCTVQI